MLPNGDVPDLPTPAPRPPRQKAKVNPWRVGQAGLALFGLGVLVAFEIMLIGFAADGVGGVAWLWALFASILGIVMVAGTLIGVGMSIEEMNRHARDWEKPRDHLSSVKDNS